MNKEIRIHPRLFLLNIFIISNILNGMIWEIVGLLLIIFFMIKEIKGRKLSNCYKILIFLIAGWIVFFMIQCRILHLPVSSIIRLWGITKTVCMPCLLFLCFYNLSDKIDLIFSVLPVILITLVLGTLEFIFSTEILNIGSFNYIGALIIIVNIYVLNKFPSNYKLFKIILFLLTSTVVMISGSRSLLLCLMLSFVYICFTEENIQKKRAYIISLFSIGVIIAILLFTYGMNYDYLSSRSGDSIGTNISRALSVFTSEGRNDQSRNDIKDRAFEQFSKFSSMQQLWGSADNRISIGMVPAHNCFIEILLCYGKIGLSYFCIYLFVLFCIILKLSKDRKFSLLVLGISLLFGMVQPFITTGIYFQILVGLVLLSGNYISISKKTIKRLIDKKSFNFC